MKDLTNLKKTILQIEYLASKSGTFKGIRISSWKEHLILSLYFSALQDNSGFKIIDFIKFLNEKFDDMIVFSEEDICFSCYIKC